MSFPAPRPPLAPKWHGNPVDPTREQAVVLYVIVVYTVIIFALWNIPVARVVITPLKLFTIGLHELFHIMAAVLTGGTILSVSIDPNLGGCTRVEGGYPSIILTAGYFGSTVVGAAFTLGGWDTLVAKILSFIFGIGLICPIILVRDKLTLFLTACFEGLLVGFWFIDHGSALRWYMLFIGIMNVFYTVWDIADDKFFRKVNDSDATQYNVLYPRIPTHAWATLWILFEIGVLISFILLGIAIFKLTADQMRVQASVFLPT